MSKDMTEQCPNHKLTEEDIVEIFHVDQNAISNITHGKTWKKIYEEFHSKK